MNIGNSTNIGILIWTPMLIHSIAVLVLGIFILGIYSYIRKYVNEIEGKLAENNRLLEERKQIFMRVAEVAVKAIEAKDEYTYGHAERVSVYAYWTALELGFAKEEALKVKMAGRLHDLGKIGLQDKILLKSKRLDDDEFAYVRHHPSIGKEILEPMNLHADLIDGIAQHHEKMDGTGYPAGLKGKEISPFARIIAVCDTYDAMTSTRPYRQALGHQEAIRELKLCSGTQFDREVVDAFLAAAENNTEVWFEMMTHEHREAGYKLR